MLMRKKLKSQPVSEVFIVEAYSLFTYYEVINLRELLGALFTLTRAQLVEGLTGKICTFLLVDLWLRYYSDMTI